MQHGKYSTDMLEGETGAVQGGRGSSSDWAVTGCCLTCLQVCLFAASHALRSSYRQIKKGNKQGDKGIRTAVRGVVHAA